MTSKNIICTVAASGAILFLAACQEEPPEPRYLGQASDAQSASDPHAGHSHAGHDHAGHSHAHPHAGHTHAPDAAPTGEAPSVEPATGLEVTLRGVTANLPDTWTEEQPSSSMRVAQFLAPGDDDDDAAGVVITHFGPQGAGDTESNIARWAGQVSNPQGPPIRASWTQGALEIHTLRATGVFSAGMAMSSDGPQAGWTLYGAIVNGGPEGPIYIKMTGPSVTVEANTQAFESMLVSLR